jgi:hypothetical protein
MALTTVGVAVCLVTADREGQGNSAARIWFVLGMNREMPFYRIDFNCWSLFRHFIRMAVGRRSIVVCVCVHSLHQVYD